MNDLDKMQQFFQKLYDIGHGKFDNPLNELQDMVNEAASMMDSCFDLRSFIEELKELHTAVEERIA